MLYNYTEYEEFFNSKDYSETIKVFKQSINNYDKWVFCCAIENEVELEKKWKTIVDDIAIDIQPNISNMISKLNIYLIFFTKQLEDTQLKSIIENDRFSMRKLVINNDMTEIDNLGEYIEKRLFIVDKGPRKNNNKTTFNQYFKSINNELFNLYENSDGKSMDSILNEYLDCLEVKNEN